MPLLALLLALFQTGGGTTPHVLVADETVRERLEPESEASSGHRPAKVYELVADSDGDVTLSLESYDFDALLSITRAAGARIDVDGGGIATNAWTRLSVRAGERLRFEILAADGRAGDFVFTARKSSEPANRPTIVVQRAAIDFWKIAAARARSRAEHARAAECFERSGRLLERYGPVPDARDAFREMLASAKQAGDNARTIEARTLLACSSMLLEGAGTVEGELTSLNEATRAEKLPDVRLLVLEALGRAHLELGHVDRSIALHEEELALARSAGKKPAECRALCLLADARTRADDVRAAERDLQQAVEIARGLDSPGVLAEVWFHYGLHFETRGMPREAYDQFRRALELEDAPLARIDLLGGMGNALSDMHQSIDARRCFEDSLRIARDLDLSRVYAPKYCLSFANLEMEFGDPEVAVSLLERARAAWSDDAHARQRGEALLSLVQARMIRRDDGDDAAGLAEAQSALDIGRRLDDLRLQVGAAILVALSAGRDTPAPEKVRKLLDELAVRAAAAHDLDASAKALGMIAWDDCSRGRYADAIRGANEAFEAFDTLGETAQCLEALDTVALAAVRGNDPESLSRALERARPILDVATVLARDPTELAISRSSFATFESYAHDLVAMRLARGGLAPAEIERRKEEGFQAAGEWKARALVERLIRRRNTAPVEESEASITARATHAALRQRLEKLSREHGPDPLLEEVHQKVVDARRQVEDIERAACTRAAEQFPDLVPRGRSSGIVRSAITDDRTAIVEFVAGTDKLQAYVLTRDRFELLRLGERRAIEAEARTFVSLLASNELPRDAPDGSSRGFEGVVKLARSLHASLLAQPLSFLGPKIDRLVIIPSSELSNLPFEALVESPADAKAPSTGFRDVAFVVRKYTIAYAPSAPALVELHSAHRPPRKPTILVFADPAYARGGGGDASLATMMPESADPLRGIEFQRLEHTRGEAARIASLVAGWARPPRGEDAIAILEIERGARDHHRSADGFELFLGPEATPERFCELAGKFSILHIAAHGLRSTASSADPVLALAPAPGKSGALTCRQVLSLDLDADLVVLSACETASGRSIDGDGVRSLARAFHHAGARSVVASLWEVRDLEAGEFMKDFYASFLHDGLSPSDALRHTKLVFLEGGAPRGKPLHDKGHESRFGDIADPYFWAGFVGSGLPK